MASYKIAEGKSLVAKRRVYGPGEEIGEDALGSKETIAALLKNGSIVEEKKNESSSGKKKDKASETAGTGNNGGDAA